MAGIIKLDGDIAVANASTLHETAAELPDPSAVRVVEGNRTEAAAEFFTERVEDASSELAVNVRDVRDFIARNAAALSNAVQALLDTDRMNAEAAGQAQSLIDDVTAGSATPSASTPGSSASRAKGAFSAN